MTRERSDPSPKYIVLVDDNFHYMDEDERYEAGRFATLEEAVTACAVRVLEDLAHLHDQPGMSAETLYDRYVCFGEDSFIVGPGLTEIPFSAWGFAKRAAPIMCQLARRRDSGVDVAPGSA